MHATCGTPQHRREWKENCTHGKKVSQNDAWSMYVLVMTTGKATSPSQSGHVAAARKRLTIEIIEDLTPAGMAANLEHNLLYRICETCVAWESECK